MILLLGGTGYIAQAFIREIDKHTSAWKAISRSEIDYTDFKKLWGLLRMERPNVVINCSAFVPNGAVDFCEDSKSETLSSHLVFPALLAEACYACGVRLIHISTGCLFNGDNGGNGYSETDPPQLSFSSKCGVYVGSKELSEHFVSQYERAYICRIRLPFDNCDHKRNYLSKLMYYEKAVRATNSISHRGDFAKAVMALDQSGAPFGTYNVTNPGAVSSAWIIEQIKKYLKPNKEFVFWDDKEFNETVARTPKSNCVLNVDKLLSVGVKMRPVEDAIIDSLKNWVALPKP